MNANLSDIVKQIVTEQGEDILSNPKRISAYFADLARDIPKPQKNAFIKSLEHGFVQTLKDVSAGERDNCRQTLTQKLHEEEGFELKLCEETLAMLVEVLFGKQKVKKEKKCKNCGKELEKEWIKCPYCSTPVPKRRSSSVTSQEDTAAAAAPVLKTTKCDECNFANNLRKVCTYHYNETPIYEAIKNCPLDKSSVPDRQLAAAQNKTVNNTVNDEQLNEKTGNMKAGLIFAICIGIIGIIIFSIIISNKSNEIDIMHRDINNLQNSNNYLRGHNNELQNRNRILEENSNEALQRNLNTLQTNYNTLQRNHTNLQNDNRTLQANYNTLQTNFNNLQRDFNASKALWRINITSLRVGNTDFDYRWINNAGSRLTSSQMRYMAPVINYNSSFSGEVTFFIKIIKPNGTLHTGANSPSGYSYSSTERINSGNNQSINLRSFGNSDSSSYQAGEYTVEVWYNNVCLISQRITIHQ
ncbi:MAG: hypothetical protein FWD13_05395 [Treponema sp.]|nr:hypothetical protein [Treponema sp.]